MDASLLWMKENAQNLTNDIKTNSVHSRVRTKIVTLQKYSQRGEYVGVFIKTFKDARLKLQGKKK